MICLVASCNEDGDAPADRDFFAVATYRGRVHVGVGHKGLDVVDEGAIVPIKENIASFKLSSSADYLFVSGSNMAVRYDGESWLGSEFSH